ncbi:tRNA-dependent cyclodipeptide synthase [Parvibium lacunae]|uniref:Cyclodipeptide synthase n=1 Tax=Parvibium lacunae TaxID=1888893 RepID=A0A368L4A0_9BURK|nr:tRNA-dependent cyclodipeptide synthase [Parvibium lacunae]RCS58397.1 tRNA-dependent cyclodipeptide synthase [Parvibium lacunae]
MLDTDYTPGEGSISFGTHRYKANLDKISPESRATLAQSAEGCLLGVSLGSANFEGARLEACIEWISERYSSCGIVVGDTVYRLTLALLEGLDEETARTRALAAGQQFLETYAPLFRQYAGKCTFSFIPFSQLESHAKLPEYHSALLHMAVADANFAASIDAFAQLYLNRGDKLDVNPFAVSLERAAEIAKSYLLEESALFAVLADMGWQVVAYPGSIDSIEGLCAGRFQGTPAPLTQLSFAALSLRKRGLYFTDGSQKVVRRSGDSSLETTRPGMEFLAECDDATWNKLFKLMKIQKFAPRETILAAGDEDRRLFLLVEGRAEVTIERSDGSRQQLAILEQGTVVGEQAFLDGLPRSAQVTALNECVARTLSQKDFRTLKQQSPELAIEVLADIGKTISLRSRRLLSEVQYFA